MERPGGEGISLMLNGESFFSDSKQHKLPKSRILWYSEASCSEFLEGEQAKTDIVGSLSCFFEI